MNNYITQLDKLKEESSFRTIKNIEEKIGKYIILENKKLLNLSSNDYLNLSTDKNLVLEFVDRYKNSNEFIFSSTSARLLSGTSRVYQELESSFAKLFKKEKALLFNTGYCANQGIVSSLFTSKDCIISDKLNHASIISGLKLSPAAHYRYKHLDYNHLEKILKEKRGDYNNAIIISESVFSMDGDIADIKKLIELKKKYNCLLMIDEAHGFGVFGENLCGVCEEVNLLNEIDIIMITLGKAFSSAGAVCLSSKTIIDYLINKASSFIFSTALPSINVLWSKFLLDDKFEFLKEKKEKLNSLFKNTNKLYPTISSSQIIPIVLGDSQLSKQIALILQKEGYYILPINPPTVPLGSSRLRLSLTSDIELKEIKELFNRIKELQCTING